MRKLVLILMMAIVASATLSAKSYFLQVSGDAKAGDAVLKAGRYNLAIDGSKAIFTNIKNGERTETPATVKEGDEKFDTTVVKTTMEAGTKKIKEIDLGGTKTRVEFQ